MAGHRVGSVFAAIIWSLQLGRFESIFQGISALISYIAPPVTAVFLWGVFWKRASGAAAVATLSFGSLLGFIVFLLDWNKAVTGWNVPFLWRRSKGRPGPAWATSSYSLPCSSRSWSGCIGFFRRIVGGVKRSSDTRVQVGSAACTRRDPRRQPGPAKTGQQSQPGYDKGTDTFSDYTGIVGGQSPGKFLQ